METLPFFHIWRLPHAHRPPGVDECARDVVVARAQHEFLVLLRRAGLYARDEACADPDPRGAVSARVSLSVRLAGLMGRGAHDRAAASPRPSAMPPAATTRMGSPVSGLRLSLHRSTTAGMRMEKGVSPVWPPPSPPCAQMMSTPCARALGMCWCSRSVFAVELRRVVKYLGVADHAAGNVSGVRC